MALNSFVSNQGTQSSLLTDNTGGVAGTLIPVMKIDVSPYGTAGTAWGGAVTITSGSINGTVNIGNTPNLGTIGTVGLATVSGNVGISSGTINVSTISTLPNTPGGTLNLATVTGNLGTIGTIGLATVSGNVGVSSGTINVSTITTLPNTPGGTLNLATVTGNLGTIGTIGLATVAGNLGTIGTLGLGTVRQDGRTTQNIITFGTQVGFSGAAAATIVGSASVGAGTSLWVNDVSLFNLQSGAGTFILGFGTAQQGTNVLLRAPIGTNSAVGIEKPYPRAVNAGMTNQDLVLSATGAGTVDLSISYFISA